MPLTPRVVHAGCIDIALHWKFALCLFFRALLWIVVMRVLQWETAGFFPWILVVFLSDETLSGPDGSRHSSDQHSKDENSENLNYCRIFVREFLSSRRQTPEVWNFCVFAVFEFLSHLPRNSRASRGRKFRFFVFFVFCGLKLLRACLKAPALTGYVEDAQTKQCTRSPQTTAANFGAFFRKGPSRHS